MMEKFISVDVDYVKKMFCRKCCHFPQWISVSERLPKNDDAVLISHGHGVAKAWWNGRAWSSVTVRCYKTVKAWMPLPEPYKEGE